MISLKDCLSMLSYLQTIHLYVSLCISVIHDSQTCTNHLKKDLEMIHNWAFQWKMNFNPDSTKQAQEVIFTRKTKKLPHPSLVFNNANVTQSIYQKHLGIILDSKLTFENHLKVETTKINKTTRFVCKLQKLYLEPIY